MLNQKKTKKKNGKRLHIDGQVRKTEDFIRNSYCRIAMPLNQ